MLAEPKYDHGMRAVERHPQYAHPFFAQLPKTLPQHGRVCSERRHGMDDETSVFQFVEDAEAPTVYEQTTDWRLKERRHARKVAEQLDGRIQEGEQPIPSAWIHLVRFQVNIGEVRLSASSPHDVHSTHLRRKAAIRWRTSSQEETSSGCCS